MLQVHYEAFILNITFARYLHVFIYYLLISVHKLPIIRACTGGKFIFTGWICNPAKITSIIMNLQFEIDILILIIKFFVTQIFVWIQTMMNSRKNQKMVLISPKSYVIGKCQGNQFQQILFCKLLHNCLDLRSKFHSKHCR